MRLYNIRRTDITCKQYRKFDEADMVATLQAMAIYMVILLFPTHDDTPLSIVDMAILVNLQKLVNYVGSVGLVIQEEMAHVQPSWEAWINITSRRRAVFVISGPLVVVSVSWSTILRLPRTQMHACSSVQVAVAGKRQGGLAVALQSLARSGGSVNISMERLLKQSRAFH